jgi:hypothetical protein
VADIDDCNREEEEDAGGDAAQPFTPLKLFHEDQDDLSPSCLVSPAGSNEEEEADEVLRHDIENYKDEENAFVPTPLSEIHRGGNVDARSNLAALNKDLTSPKEDNGGDTTMKVKNTLSPSHYCNLQRMNNVSHQVNYVKMTFDEATFRKEINKEIAFFLEEFDTLNCGPCISIPIATEISLVMMSKLRLVDELTRGDLNSDNIHYLLEMYRSVIEGIDECRKEFTTIERKKVDIYSDHQSRGELMISLLRTAKVDYKFLLSNVEQDSALGNAVRRFLGNDARGNERNLTVTALKEISIYPQAVKNCLTILVNLSSAIDVLAGFSVTNFL